MFEVINKTQGLRNGVSRCASESSRLKSDQNIPNSKIVKNLQKVPFSFLNFQLIFDENKTDIDLKRTKMDQKEP